MRRILFFPFLALCAMLCVSCDLFSRKEGTVHVIAVGLDYGCGLGGQFTVYNKFLGSSYQLSGLDTEYDALTFGECLEKTYEERGCETDITYLVSQGTPDLTRENYPSPENIVSRIRETDAGDEDLTIVFLSSHGGVTDGSMAFVVGRSTTDTSSAYADAYRLLALEELNDALSSLSGSKILVLDCCQSGAALSGADTDWASLFSSAHWNDAALLLSSSESEDSYMMEIQSGGSSYPVSLWTRALSEAVGWEYGTSGSESTSVSYDGGTYSLTVGGALADPLPSSEEYLASDWFDSASSLLEGYGYDQNAQSFYGQSEIIVFPEEE